MDDGREAVVGVAICLYTIRMVALVPIRKVFIVAITCVVVAIAGAYFASTEKRDSPIEAAACTQEALLCADGSSVGRVGPSCEFALCPEAIEVERPGMPKPLAIEQTGEFSGVSLTPLAVTEDERCPADDACELPGKLKVRARLSGGDDTKEVTITLGERLAFAGRNVALVGVAPLVRKGVPLDPEDYILTFAVSETAP